MKYYFRNSETDFFRWCTHYVKESLKIVEMYENPNLCYHYILSEKYHEALKIKRQYNVLCCAINDEQKQILENIINREPNPYTIRAGSLQSDIFEKWQEICFPNNKNAIKQLDSYLLGRHLREIRINKGFTVAKVSGILNISPKRIYDYETGTRLINLNILYGLTQIYEISIDQMLKQKELLLMESV